MVLPLLRRIRHVVHCRRRRKILQTGGGNRGAARHLRGGRRRLRGFSRRHGSKRGRLPIFLSEAPERAEAIGSRMMIIRVGLGKPRTSV